MGDLLIENACKFLQQEEQNIHSSGDSQFLLRQTTESCEDSGIFSGKKTGTLHDWIGQVNSKLSTSASRLEGLLLLRAIVRQCSLETLKECSITWTRLLIAIFQPHQSPHIIEVASGVLIELLREAAQINEISRDLAINHIPGLLSKLLSAEDQHWIPSSLHLIQVSMQLFPGPCGTVSYKLEAFITSHLLSDNQQIQQLSQRCYPTLASLGGGGAGGVKHSEAFKHYSTKLIHTLSSLLAMLYTDFQTESDSTKDEEIEPLALPLPPPDEPLRSFQLTRQIEALTGCLHNMLRRDFPAPARVPVKSLLEYISNALDVTSKTLGDNVTIESSMLALVTPRIHQAALQLLSALMESCPVSHYGHQINLLLIKTLGWTQTQGPGQVKLYSNLRTEAYKSIVTWLKTRGAASGLATQVGDKLVHQCIKDASPPTDTTKLASNVKTTSDKKGGKSKSKVKGQTLPGNELSGGYKTDHHTNETLCVASLQALRQLIVTSGIRLKANIHNEVYGFVIPMLARIQSSASTDLPPPYTATECRQALYRVLLAGVLVPHPQAMSPLNLAVALFREGKNDRSLEVSSTCTEASLVCEALIHPRRPPAPPSKATPTTTSFPLQTTPNLMSITQHATPPSSSLVPEHVTKRDEERMDVSESGATTSEGKEGKLKDVETACSKDESVGKDRMVSESGDEKDGLSAAERDDGEVARTKEKDEVSKEGSLEKEDEEEEEEEEEKQAGGAVEVKEDTEEKKSEEVESEVSTRKRKHSAVEPEKGKKQASEEMESMMSAFIDAPPDLE